MLFDPSFHLKLDGLTFLNTRLVLFNNRIDCQRRAFPVYRYSDDATGELVLVTEDRYEALLDRMMAMGAFGATGDIS